jgi:drug/metabolite transporter (DMT)-like permease
VGVALALIVMLSWGVSDYLGGLAARNIDSKVFSFFFQFLSIPLVIPMAIVATLVFGGAPQPVDVVIGIVWGLDSAFITSTLFFRALAGGNITIVAPVAGVTMAIVPAAFSVFVFGEHIGRIGAAGIIIGTIAIALLSLGPSDAELHRNRPWMLKTITRDFELGLVCGLGFALYFIIVDRASPHAYLWPFVIARVTAAIVLYQICRFAGLSTRLPARRWLPWLLIFFLDAFGNGVFFFATHHGVLAMVAVIVALSPAVMTVLAILHSKERLRPLQAVGLSAALLGVTLTTAGQA